jgi:beta-galactosidase
VTPVDLQATVDAGTGSLAAVALPGGAVASAIAGPALVRGTLELDEPCDLHLALDGFGKGVAWVNGFCLGRYWSRGPQHTLYVPGPVLRAGSNEVVVFEQHAAVCREVEFRSTADLGHTEA